MLSEPGLKALLRMKDMIVMARHDNHLLPNLKLLPAGEAKWLRSPDWWAASRLWLLQTDTMIPPGIECSWSHV